MVLKQYIDGLVDVAVPVTGKSDVAVLQNKLGQRSPRRHGKCRRRCEGHSSTPPKFPGFELLINTSIIILSFTNLKFYMHNLLIIYYFSIEGNED